MNEKVLKSLVIFFAFFFSIFGLLIFSDIQGEKKSMEGFVEGVKLSEELSKFFGEGYQVNGVIKKGNFANKEITFEVEQADLIFQVLVKNGEIEKIDYVALCEKSDKKKKKCYLQTVYPKPTDLP